jgi:hypothetical protein
MNVEKAIGKKCWIVPDGYIPQLTENDSSNQNGYVSHECTCILNTGPNDAQIELTIYFEDTEPVVIDGLVIAAKRCWHMRMDELKQGNKSVIERGVPYGLVINSSEPVIVQMSRLDTTQSNMAFLSTMAHAIEEE